MRALEQGRCVQADHQDSYEDARQRMRNHNLLLSQRRFGGATRHRMVAILFRTSRVVILAARIPCIATTFGADRANLMRWHGSRGSRAS
jgi:hypothetical protein